MDNRTMWRRRWWGGLRPVLQTGRSSNPGGTLAGFRWSLIPAVESHTGRQVHHPGQDICTIWAKNQKLLKRALLLMGEESRCQAKALGRGTRQVQGRRKGLESDSAHISHTPGEPHLAHLGNFARCQTNTSFVHILHVLHLVLVLTYIACSNKQNQSCQVFRANIK